MSSGSSAKSLVKYVSVTHPRANGQAERANGMVLHALKKRLYQKDDKYPGRWLKELSPAVWGLRTQTSRSTGVSPYYMVYRSEAVLLEDVAFRSPRVENYSEEISDQARADDVDRAEEERLAACVRSAKYLEGVRRYYDRNVRERSFAAGDLVLRRRQSSAGMHKLSSP